jgi:integrase
MQRGQIFRTGGSWYVRFYEDQMKDGKSVRRRVCQKLARYSDAYRSKKDVYPLAEPYLAPVNSGQLQPESSLTLSEFIERHFLPHVERKRRPATVKFYKTTYKVHVKEPLGSIRIRDFTTKHAQNFLDAIPRQSHQSLLRIKALLSGVFTYARQQDVIRAANPIQGVKAEGRRTKPERYAYSLEEIQHMLAILPEPAKTVVAVAAFTGLRAAELRGIRWEDYTEDEIRVARTVWRTHVVEDAKNEASAANVPVIPILRKVLDLHRKSNPDGYIFAGQRRGAPLHLDNLSRRVIAPKLKGGWHGWHAFRRGLATNLFILGVQDKTIQQILRHANVATTQQHYIVIESEKAKAAMKTFEKAVNKVWAKAESSKQVGQRMGKENKRSAHK